MKSLQVASPKKILIHSEKVKKYLAGNRIFPATLELDITDACSRKCKDCPSARSSFNRRLEIGFIDRLLGNLEGATRGLILTGGEPTLSALFPRVLSLARQRGFQDIAVATNGSFLHKNSVSEAMLAHATTIRLSLYDRGPESCSNLDRTFQRIQKLRDRIDAEKSSLQIGVSLLTSKKNASSLIAEAEKVKSAGAHWVYFHPTCIRWHEGAPRQISQESVLETIEFFRQTLNGGFHAHVMLERYGSDPIEFSAYHAAHFLMVVGADGLNYLAPEVKYQPEHVLADLGENMNEGFLWRSERTGKISNVKSKTYPAIGSRHRGALYSHLLEKLAQAKRDTDLDGLLPGGLDFRFPHIL